jgi:hypothetical protein
MGSDSPHRIRAGDAAAHHGNAVTDASLYESGGQTETDIITQIYGLGPSEILSLCKC